MWMFREAQLSFSFVAVFAYNILFSSEVEVLIIWGLFLLTVPSVFRVQHTEFQYHSNTKHCNKIVWVQSAIAGRKKHEEMYKCKLSQKRYFEYYRRKINNEEPFTE